MEAMPRLNSLGLNLPKYIQLCYCLMSNLSIIETNIEPQIWGLFELIGPFHLEKNIESFERKISILWMVVCLQGLSHHLCLRAYRVLDPLPVMRFPENIITDEETNFTTAMHGNEPMNRESTSHTAFYTIQKLLPNRGLLKAQSYFWRQQFSSIGNHPLGLDIHHE